MNPENYFFVSKYLYQNDQITLNQLDKKSMGCSQTPKRPKTPGAT